MTTTAAAITISSSKLRAEILTYGATLKSVVVKGKHGEDVDVLLGCDDEQGYREDQCYLGRVVGRVANRIRHGQATIGGKPVQLDINRAPHHLHGGTGSLAFKTWTVVDKTEKDVHLTVESEAGESGYPGKLTVHAFYRVSDNELYLELQATVQDAPTLVNLTHHGYWNLDGEGGNGTIANHRLQIAASKFTPVNEAALVADHPQPVEGTKFDFRKERTIAETEGQEPYGYDNDFLLDKAYKAVVLKSSKTGITLTLNTSYPTVHVYTGRFLNTRGKNGHQYGAFQGVAIEAQFPSDAPNWPDSAGSIELSPASGSYKNYVSYTFETD